MNDCPMFESLPEKIGAFFAVCGVIILGVMNALNLFSKQKKEDAKELRVEEQYRETLHKDLISSLELKIQFQDEQIANQKILIAQQDERMVELDRTIKVLYLRNQELADYASLKDPHTTEFRNHVRERLDDIHNKIMKGGEQI